jgi:hypothetical protein
LGLASAPRAEATAPLFLGLVGDDSRLIPLGSCSPVGCSRLRGWPQPQYEVLPNLYKPASAKKVPADWWGRSVPPNEWFVVGESPARPFRIGGPILLPDGKDARWCVVTSLPIVRRKPEEPEIRRIVFSRDVPFLRPAELGAGGAEAALIRRLAEAELDRLERKAVATTNAKGTRWDEVVAPFRERAHSSALPTTLRIVRSGDLSDGRELFLAELTRWAGELSDEFGRYPGGHDSFVEVWVLRDAGGSFSVLSARQGFDDNPDYEFEKTFPLGFFELDGVPHAFVIHGGEIAELYSVLRFECGKVERYDFLDLGSC